LIIEQNDLNEILDTLSQLDCDSYHIGHVNKGSGQIVLR
jgi:phosphoribosylaminoimidazole (AIR) synthetase